MLKNTAGDYISPDTLNKMIKTFGNRLPGEFEALFNCQNARPAHIVRIESFLECDIALEVFGDEMNPDFIAGEIVLCDLVEKSGYIYNLPYIVITDKLNVLRYIKDSGKPDTLLLVPSNGSSGTQEVAQHKIKQLFLVKGKIRRFYR
jgi:hypothetical protein